MKFLIVIILGMFATIANCQTIHWLVFVDTNDNQIGHSSMNSRKHLFHDFIDITNTFLSEKGVNHDVQDIKGDSLSPDRCKEIIKNLNCKPNDIVVFYYIGHGYNTVANNNPFPLMTMGTTDLKESIPLSWVHESIKKKNPRLSISISVCSNSFHEKRLPEQETALDSMNNKLHTHNLAIKSVNTEKSVCDLFLNYKGDIIVTSSSLKQPSFGLSDIDCFTYSIVSVFEKMYKAGTLDWCNLLKETRHEVDTITDGKQKPIWECNLTHKYQFNHNNDNSN